MATESDLAAINDIYNHYVLNSTCTYQETPELIEDRRTWFQNHGAGYPVVIAEQNARVVGWGALSPYHKRSAYRHTVEVSVYVHQDWHRHGIGSFILRDLITQAGAFGHHAIIAGIDADQAASIALHAKFNFRQVGRLIQVGRKFGRWLDVVYMELEL